MIRSASLLLVLTVLAAAATHWLHPKAPAWYLAEEPLKDGEVTLQSIQERWQGNVLWIDARQRQEFEKGHVPRALLLNEQELDALLTEHIERLQYNRLPIVIYCDGHACQASQKMRDYLTRNLALTDVWVLHGGWPAWEKALR